MSFRNESHIYSWEDSVENFFEFGKELEVCAYTFELMKLLVKNMDDLKRFIDLYDGDINNWKNTLYKML